MIKIEYRWAGVDIGLVFSRLGWPTHVWENIQIIGNIYLFSILWENKLETIDKKGEKIGVVLRKN